MSLEHAILGFVNYRPFSGYDLKKVLDASISHFWPANQSQIYRTLARLSERGYLTVEVVQQESHPNRKVYSITEEGRVELRRWMGEDPSREVFREPFLVQCFFAGMLNDAEVLGVLEAKARELRDWLTEFKTMAAEINAGDLHPGPLREQFFWCLPLDHGLWYVQSTLEWVEDTIARIERKEYEHGGRVLAPPKRRERRERPPVKPSHAE